MQYVVLLFRYLKEWRKNPHWSLSCCLALLLPLINLPGEISGLVGTNATDTQLDTGQMGMPTVTGAVKDSGVIDVTLDNKEQDNDNPLKAQGEDFKGIQPQGRDVESPTIHEASKESGAIDDTLDHGEQDESIFHDAGYSNRKIHHATQTELSANFAIGRKLLVTKSQ